MSAGPGQAPSGPRRIHRTLAGASQIVGALLSLGLVAILGLGVLLAQRPVHIEGLVRRFAPAPAGTRLVVGGATLFWDHRSQPATVLLALSNTALIRDDGMVAAQLMTGSAAVRPGPLLLGRIDPVAVTVNGGSLAIARAADGAIGLDTGEPIAGSHPPATGGGISAGLTKLSVRGFALSLRDQPTGRRAAATIIRIEATGLPGTATGDADVRLALGGQSAELTATLAGLPGHSVLTATCSAINPASLAPLVAPLITRWVPGGLGALAGIDLPVATAWRLGFGPHWQPGVLALHAAIGAGTVTAGRDRMTLTGGTADGTADLTRHTAHVSSLRLGLAGGSQEPPPTFTLAATANWRGTSGAARLSADIDRLPFAELGRYWPSGTAHDARAWMGANATAGFAQAIHADVALGIDQGAVLVRSVTGHLEAEDLTLNWLRPAPPLVHATAALNVLSTDVILITIMSATQSPSDQRSPPLAIPHATMRISGLSGAVQTGAIDADVDGQLPQLLALLREPRLRLLSVHPISFADPAGLAHAHLQVTLPLDNSVTMDQIAIRTDGRLTNLHLGGVAAGRDLDQGMFAVKASNTGLTLAGPALLAQLPVQVAIAMDFEGGPPQQVIARYDVSGAPTSAQLQSAGLPSGYLDGRLAFKASVVEHRDNSGVAAIHIDLGDAALAVPPLGWQRPAGGQTAADALIRLNNDRVTGIDQFSVNGDGVSVLAHAVYTGGRPSTLVFDHILLGRTDAAGVLRLPTPKDPALHAELHGKLLDLSGQPAAKPAATPSRAQAQAAARLRHGHAVAARGLAWGGELHFGRIMLGTGRSLQAVAGTVTDDGWVIRHAEVSGYAGGGSFRAAIGPAPGNTRSLAITSANAGGLLGMLDVVSGLRGGGLKLDARYDDTQPGHPLSGTMLIDNFRLTGAPAATRLLQAMTLYGVVDVLRGPGLGITHLIAPFSLADNVLSLRGARAFSASLGFTAEGQVDLTAQRADLTGTIVPAYFFNAILGNVPVVGKLFSPEKGGGVFAATYQLTGPLGDPAVHVNPLAALTPGFLRGLFGSSAPPPAAPAP